MQDKSYLDAVYKKKEEVFVKLQRSTRVSMGYDGWL